MSIYCWCVRCIPHQNSQRLFWACVCVCFKFVCERVVCVCESGVCESAVRERVVCGRVVHDKVVWSVWYNCVCENVGVWKNCVCVPMLCAWKCCERVVWCAPPDPAQRHKCNACHTEVTLMSPSATPATQCVPYTCHACHAEVASMSCDRVVCERVVCGRVVCVWQSWWRGPRRTEGGRSRRAADGSAQQKARTPHKDVGNNHHNYCIWSGHLLYDNRISCALHSIILPDVNWRASSHVSANTC